jgi:hypothetical protein
MVISSLEISPVWCSSQFFATIILRFRIFFQLVFALAIVWNEVHILFLYILFFFFLLANIQTIQI